MTFGSTNLDHKNEALDVDGANISTRKLTNLDFLQKQFININHLAHRLSYPLAALYYWSLMGGLDVSVLFLGRLGTSCLRCTYTFKIERGGVESKFRSIEGCLGFFTHTTTTLENNTSLASVTTVQRLALSQLNYVGNQIVDNQLSFCPHCVALKIQIKRK